MAVAARVALSLGVGLYVWSAAGCTRGAQHGARPAEPAEHAAKPAQVASPDLAAWNAGRLPASVLEGAPQPGGQLTIGVAVDPPSLNILLDSDWTAARIVRHRVYQSLVRVDPYDDPNYRILPELAERWEVSPDGRTYTFHLRKDVRWQDGEPFSAADVSATFDKILDPSTKAASTRSYLAELDHYRALDAQTFELVWKRPYFLALDTIADLTIQPAHIIAKLSGAAYNEAAANPINRHPIGTGPYKFVAWEPHSKIVLERNQDYWGRAPYLDRVLFRTVEDAGSRLALAERGELDILHQLKSDQWVGLDPALRQRWNRSSFYGSNYAFIAWNTLRPPFADARVRRALTLLTDRPGIIDKLLYGLAKPTSCHFYWASAACDPAQKPLPYDPTAAGRLLDAAGYRDHDGDGVRDKDGRPLRFVLMLPSAAAEAARWAAMLKEDYGRAGVELELQKVEWSAFLKRLRDHEFDAASLLWASDARSDPTQIWHSSSIAGGSNYISYRNPELDRVIEQARAVLDPDARNALFRRFGAILQTDQPYTFLYVRPELDLLSKRVKGARANLYYWQFEDLWLDRSGEAH